MIIRVAVAALLLLTGGTAAAAVLGKQSAPAAPPQLHSVWCVSPGYPADLAVPYVAGPGTGLAGCPVGTVQVTEP